MHILTKNLLERLWQGDPSFKIIAGRLKQECVSMTPPEAGVIGRDLILRKNALYTKDFKIAAYLASDGSAGNDGFMDFTDCVALLPDKRYRRILEDHDFLVADSVSADFEEYYLVSEVCRVFDRALFDGEDDDDLLYYLVLGDKEVDWSVIDSATEIDAKTKLPRLYAKFGHLFQPSERDYKTVTNDTVSLESFFGAAGIPGIDNKSEQAGDGDAEEAV